jgi:hypothetical protein
MRDGGLVALSADSKNAKKQQTDSSLLQFAEIWSAPNGKKSMPFLKVNVNCLIGVLPTRFLASSSEKVCQQMEEVTPATA